MSGHQLLSHDGRGCGCLSIPISCRGVHSYVNNRESDDTWNLAPLTHDERYQGRRLRSSLPMFQGGRTEFEESRRRWHPEADAVRVRG